MSQTTDTRERLLQSARALIYASSYAEVGVAAICAHAGVKKGSFYHFFPSKRDLTMAVLEEFWTGMKEGLLARAFAPDLPPLERIARKARMLYEMQKDLAVHTGHLLGCPFGNLAAELSTSDEAIRQKLDQIFRRFEGYILAAVREAAENGTIGPVDAEATAQAMIAYIEGVMLMAKTRNDPEVLGRLLPAVTGIRVAPTRAG